MSTDNKKPHRKNIADEYAAEIIRQLKEGAAPWQKPWKAGEFIMPFNPTRNTNYRGINVAMLAGNGYADPRWMTFNQAKEKNLKVKKGSKSQRVVFWQWQNRQTILDDKGQPVVDSDGQEVKETVDLSRPRLYVYNVFNASQLRNEKGEDLELFKAKEPEWNPNERAEAILRNSGADISHDQLDRAFYRIAEDGIHLPPRANFPDEGHYYSTALHELCHWTGHESRMNREFGAKGTEQYAKEELRAEIASWMICQELGLPYDPGQHVAYVDSWIKALEEDPYEIMRACQVAEKIKAKVMDMEQGITIEQAMADNEPSLFNQSSTDLEQAQQYDVKAFRRVHSADEPQSKPWLEVEEGQKADFYAVVAKDSGRILATSSTLEAAEMKFQSKQLSGSNLPNVADEKVFLDVPFIEKNMTKKLGATWDNGQKLWCARPGTDLEPLAKWIPENTIAELVSKGVLTVPEAAPEISAPQKLEEMGKAAAVVELAAEKTYLEVPYKEKEAAKKLGAKWDRNAGLWYAPEGANLAPLAKYLPEKILAPAKEIIPEVEFAQALEKAGLKVEGLPVIDGKIHRVPVIDGKPGNRDGAYCAYADGRPAGWMMNYREGGEKIKWVATGQTLTVEQKALLAVRAEERRAEREVARRDAQEAAMAQAAEKWNDQDRARPAQDDHPYLVKKGIPAQGLKQDAIGNLLVPGIDTDGRLRTIQAINAQGGKFFEPGCPKAGAMHVIGGDSEKEAKANLREIKAPQIYISEGYATGATVHLATKNPVVMAFDANNLKAVAMAIREIHPEANIVICADNDHKHDKNVGLEKAQEAAKAVGGEVISPEFTQEEKARGLTDFNDLHQARGLGAVRDALQNRQSLGRAAAQIRPAVSQKAVKSVKSAGMGL